MMSERGGSLDLDDEDRLPWLEPAGGSDQDDDSVPVGRLAAFILGGLALIGVIVGGVYLLRSVFSSDANVETIAAPEGEYKVAAKDADAKKFQGEGDASFAASEGKDGGGRIDPSLLPETPIAPTGSKSASGDKAAAARASASVNAPVTSGGPVKPAASDGKAASSPSGPAIQLGAYASDAIAQEAWTRFSKRFDYLADLGHNVQPVTVGGNKFYRLRASVGAGQANMICGKLKVAGESCIVVN